LRNRSIRPTRPWDRIPVDERAEAVWQASRELYEVAEPGSNERRPDLASVGKGFKMGEPPRRIDILTQIEGVTFEQAWPGRREARFGDVDPGDRPRPCCTQSCATGTRW
jgi:hypothetical protein